jgi:predicted dehydrogenase
LADYLGDISMHDIRLITVDPGHFHAALVQKEMYPEVSSTVQIFAPLGPDLLAHLQRITDFNCRTINPTSWNLEVHTGPDFLDQLIQDKPGNVVVLAGFNSRKIDYLHKAVSAGFHILSDKPWIIAAKELPRLLDVLEMAEQKGLVAYDIMTERYEITSILQREFVNDKEILGDLETGSIDHPAVVMESVHYLKKTVAGVPLLRPAWFFDIHQQGEGLSDVGTHLVDLVFWILFPHQAIDYLQQIHMVEGKRWPTLLHRLDFQQVTGLTEFPEFLNPMIEKDRLAYFCNNRISYTVRGIHVTLNVLWDFEAAMGAGDSHLAIVRGSRSQIEIRQSKDEKFVPELYVANIQKPEVKKAVQNRIEQLQSSYSDLAIEDQGPRLRVVIPQKYRVGHEAHFAEVTKQFLRYLTKKDTMPAWEKPNMLAKYFVTTQGVEMAKESPQISD